jgi:hypothetical protein
MDIFLAVEDALSKAVAEKLLLSSGVEFQIKQCFCKHGYGYLKSNLNKFSNIAKTTPLLLITDLDREDCAPDLIWRWLGKKKPHKGLLFRVAVRETEAWLLADADGFAAFSGVPVTKIPHEVESLPDPKSTLIELVRRYGKRSLKADIVLQPGICAKVGLAYNPVLCPFVQEIWSPERAEGVANSLARVRSSISKLGQTLSLA